MRPSDDNLSHVPIPIPYYHPNSMNGPGGNIMLFRKKKGEEIPPEEEEDLGPMPGQAEGAPEAGPAHPAQPLFNEAMGALNSEKYDDAIYMLNNILQQYPDFEPSLLNYGLGVAYDAKGQLDWAESYLQYAVQANVQNFEAHIFLGNIYAKMGRNTDAIAEFSFVIENNPEHELVPGLKAQIEEMRGFSKESARGRLVEEVEAFRVLVKRQFKIDLPYDLKGVELINMIMDTGWNDTIIAGSFIGEVLVRSMGCTWVMKMPKESSYIDCQGKVKVNPFDLATHKAEKGNAFDLTSNLKALKQQFGL